MFEEQPLEEHKEFDRETIEFFLKDSFKGLSKEYILDKIFDEEIQKNWTPQVGDVMVGCTGNIFVINVIDELHETLGGRRYYFGGGSCNRDGGNILNSTYQFTANESGVYYGWGDSGIEKQDKLDHSSIRDFRFVPYPHEL